MKIKVRLIIVSLLVALCSLGACNDEQIESGADPVDPDDYIYIVTFDSNEATTAADPGTKSVINPATTVDSLPADPVRTDFTFAGWFTDEDIQFDETTPVTADITVTARWNPVAVIKYIVTYKDGDATIGVQHIIYPDTTVPILPFPSKNWFVFNGWFTAEGAPFLVTTPVTADITLYARWNVKTIYAIGEVGPGGGTVFYITDGGLHGLEAAPASTEWYAQWGKFGTAVENTYLPVGYGSSNTTRIVSVLNAAPADSGRAAQLCRGLTSGGYSDWFLPSREELTLMYQNLHKAALGPLGGFTNTNYWSSSEYSSFQSEYAWVLAFNAGNTAYVSKKGTQRVRAIRAF
jgi:uncharacterized repeat protein (TIGR02543 family)